MKMDITGKTRVTNKKGTKMKNTREIGFCIGLAIFATAGVFGVASFAAEPAAKNYVSNPGMEVCSKNDGIPDGRMITKGLTSTLDETVFQEGRKSVKLTGKGEFIVRVFSLNKDQTYKFRFYYKTQGGTFSMSAYCRGAGYKTVGEPVGFMAIEDTDWKKFETEFTVPADFREDFMIDFKISATKGSVWLDSFVVEEKLEPAASAPATK